LAHPYFKELFSPTDQLRGAASARPAQPALIVYVRLPRDFVAALPLNAAA